MILMYHNIDQESGFNSVPVTEFRKQMDYLRNSGKYNILSLDEYVENLINPSVNNPLTVTFDDGYISLTTLVLPIIQKYNVPITVFVPTKYVGGHNAWDTVNGHSKIDILDWESLSQLIKEELVHLGSHGVHHLSHGPLGQEAEIYEIATSKKILEEKLGIEVRYYSYPYGQLKDLGAHSINNLKTVGYKAALSTIWSRKNHQWQIYRLNRLEILGTDGLNSFISKLESVIDGKSIKQILKNKLYKVGVLR